MAQEKSNKVQSSALSPPSGDTLTQYVLRSSLVVACCIVFSQFVTYKAQSKQNASTSFGAWLEQEKKKKTKGKKEKEQEQKRQREQEELEEKQQQQALLQECQREQAQPQQEQQTSQQQ
jgi:hypothetical protein